MQLLAEESEELAATRARPRPGRVVRLETQSGERVPNIGWCDVTPAPDALLTVRLSPEHRSISCTAMSSSAARRPMWQRPSASGPEVTVAVQRGNIHYAQFHPEKAGGCRALGARRIRL
jgi:glutamine amidotransferase